VVGCSSDTTISHEAWNSRSRESGGGGSIGYPLISDANKELSTTFSVTNDNGKFQPTWFLINPEGTIIHTGNTIEVQSIYSTVEKYCSPDDDV